MKVKKWVYLFREGNAKMKNLLGGKGANLAEMTRIGLPVPPGFIITTEACNQHSKTGKFPEGMWQQTLQALQWIEKQTGKKFGDETNPLFVSVRSGAKFSMPGMMDTVLNLGLNEKTLKGLTRLTQNPRFCQDAYRRFIQMFGKIVMGIPAEKFEDEIQRMKEDKGVRDDTDLDVEDLRKLVKKFKAIYEKETRTTFPEDPLKQLEAATKAVFKSWNGKRAVDYRNFHKIPHDLGTAVNVVTMVFGNMGFDSGTGVVFTRNPATGEKKFYGEYLLNAQGEDVVAGIRTPEAIDTLQNKEPELYKQLAEIAKKLERHYKDIQDLEFTIEKGKLWMLQTRAGKRTAQAEVKIAADMVGEGLIKKEEALLRVTPEQVEQLLHPMIDPKAKVNVIAKGLNASPGAATGKAVFDADRAEERAKKEDVILVRPETNPDDVHGMLASKGILTARGGMTSHAAVVARGLGKPCVAGCETIKVNVEKREFMVNGLTVKEGDLISVNGTTGEVILGKVPLVEPKITEELKVILRMADQVKRLGVKANADNPKDAKKAREYGAEGIGLCRTEHMFFGPERRPLIVKMIMARDDKTRQKYLDKLLPYQQKDFEGLFEVMDGFPVTIRLIDPPMHEFLPPREELIREVATLKAKKKKKGLKAKEKMLEVVEAMWEINPMLGLRGCRVGIIYPQVSEMQVKAIFQAAARVAKRGFNVHPEIMIPLVSHINELKIEQKRLERVAKEVMRKEKIKFEYQFGTMIEMPRAALLADEIAQLAEFFSFGTNDLTQTTFALSRDDAEGKFLFPYIERGIYESNPFETLDQKGVGKLVEIGTKLGRKTNPNLEVGICGEHGGNPASVEFFHRAGLDYVSCSPFRVPIARLAAAQAVIKEKKKLKEQKDK